MNPSIHFRRRERRHAPRLVTGECIQVQVTDLLDQEEERAGIWDIGPGGTCLLVESRYRPGTRLAVELQHTVKDAALFAVAEVRHSDICCPSERDIWMTGCRFQSDVTPEEVAPFTDRDC